MSAATAGRPVVVRDADNASGMATMLAELLHDNLRDFPGRARVAACTRGALVLTAADRDVSITLTFGPDQIEVADGAQAGAPVMAGSWLAMSNVCSGRTGPLRALATRELKLRWGRAMWVAPMAGFALSVPASFYDESVTERRRRIVIVVAATGAVLAVAVAARSALRRARSVA